MFVDKINLTLLSGSGGSGSISFSSKSSKTSPNGASGGNGGSIILKTRKDLFDFSHIYSKSIFKAENGGDASKNLQSGKNAGDLVIEVPLGTSIYDDEGLISVLLNENEELLLLEGGKGGAGNKDLKSKRNPNPSIAEQGQRRFKKEVRLDLSLITDIAILGLPNSGKSTLIKKITNSNAKTDSYPFTTISPNLGVLESLNSKYTICDLPGLIKGAATGVGLGKSILKHLMNTKVLIFLLDPLNTELNIDEQIQLLEDEIFAYEKKLKNLTVLKVINKSDLSKKPNGMINISALEGLGIDKLLEKIDELNKSINNKNKDIDDKLIVQHDKMNYIQQLTLNNYCSMNFTQGPPSNKREKNIQTFCKQKAKEYKWDREYYGY